MSDWLDERERERAEKREVDRERAGVDQARDAFDVWQFFHDGSQEKVREGVSAEEAVKAARHYTDNVAAQLGIVERVIITGDGDDCVFEWKRGEGVTFPEECRGRR
jgi:hypothetical protein